LRRAANSSSAEWTIEDFSRSVLANNESLVEAIDKKDWGMIYGAIPPIPDVRRSVIASQITEVFIDGAENEDGIKSCALTGLSGIGKSSAVAGYVAEHADEYDLILWVEANFTENLMASFRRISERLSTPRTRQTQVHTAEYHRENVHEALRGMPGRWLIVFDDATASIVPPCISSSLLSTVRDGTISINESR
jgi:hypothetical protein